MGGLFRAPKPVVVAATVPAAAPPAAASPEVAAQAARLDSQDRARRGLAGTIATSARGVVEAAPETLAPGLSAQGLAAQGLAATAQGLAGARKTLLGE